MMFLQITNQIESLSGPGQFWRLASGVFLLIVLLALMGWVGWILLKRSEDPARLVFKWIISLPVLGVLIFVVAPLVAKGGWAGAFGGVPMAAVCGLFLAFIWRDNLVSIVANVFGNLYDGGTTPPEPEPFYSLAIAKRKRGHYADAIADIRGQLEKFPNDFRGQFMIAEILAENLNDLSAADLAIQRICNQKTHPRGSVVMALNALADWQIKYAQDREAARLVLERIMELFPETESSALAAQRIAHLASSQQIIAASEDRPRFVVKAGLENMGLLPEAQQFKAPEEDFEKQVADYVRHLEIHPLDTEAREKLAVLYANHYGRLDLAADQLEQLIAHREQPQSRVVHWLNLLADLQVEHGASFETARATLQRIVDSFPETAAAYTAQSRLALIKLEYRKKEKSQTVKLGSYEQDIGLKQGRGRDC